MKCVSLDFLSPLLLSLPLSSLTFSPSLLSYFLSLSPLLLSLPLSLSLNPNFSDIYSTWKILKHNLNSLCSGHCNSIYTESCAECVLPVFFMTNAQMIRDTFTIRFSALLTISFQMHPRLMLYTSFSHSLPLSLSEEIENECFCEPIPFQG